MAALFRTLFGRGSSEKKETERDKEEKKTVKPKVDQMPSQPGLTKHDSSVLDLAFAMDCTASMSSYINSAKENIRKIVEEIVSSEKSDVKLALVEYRDHPPQDSSFITRSHDFTGSVSKMKGWLDNCSAQGGGDKPEAVADALHDVLKLSWRAEATKICVLISDAPPHGLDEEDGFPDGCPLGLDPMQIVRDLAEKGVTLYSVGCEPAINNFKDFFTAIAYITGGQYVPLTAAKILTQVIIGGAQEEITLERWMADVDEEVRKEMEAGREVNEEEMSKVIGERLKMKGAKAKKLMRNKCDLDAASDDSKVMSKFTNMKDMKSFQSKLAPKASAPGSMLMMGGGFGASPCDDEYEAVESSISEYQAVRMVQKSKARNVMLMKKS